MEDDVKLSDLQSAMRKNASSTVCGDTGLPGVEDTQKEEDESHDALSVPPLDSAVLLGRASAVQPDDAQEAGVAPALCSRGQHVPSYLHSRRGTRVYF